MNEESTVTFLTDELRIKFRGHGACKHDGGFSVDAETGDVECKKCNQAVSAAHALITLSHNWRRREEQINQAFGELAELRKYQPHLKQVKKLESIWRGRMLPCCPHCSKPIEADGQFGSRCVWNPKRATKHKGAPA